MNTIFLATVIGWVMVIGGLFLIFRHEHMKLVMADVMAHQGVFFVFAFMTFILGLLMVTSHNLWLMGWPVIITVISWLVLLSGMIRLACPDTAMKIGQSFFNHPVRMQVTGVIFLIIGLFLLVHVYYLHS
ncbi:hypothetical protein [Legionella fallonii]|uniref:Integral membrane protein (PIN domain superfamily) n=1 Tax=Legionella fallonii LLAP-10 TaxID=1212491 RepID=A0A098G6W1_9GAMM|nr:hypothetical protein [Legionella fallonii]CEG57731.1 conserved membrane protein of unknown function [Legionella fallonii LLAP-10]